MTKYILRRLRFIFILHKSRENLNFQRFRPHRDCQLEVQGRDSVAQTCLAIRYTHYSSLIWIPPFMHHSIQNMFALNRVALPQRSKSKGPTTRPKPYWAQTLGSQTLVSSQLNNCWSSLSLSLDASFLQCYGFQTSRTTIITKQKHKLPI